ncbi:MAG TPA: alpha/beta hydrolase [Thermoanaerobaculia bacterium]|nr:alpha/beta hydrolase [Thermoanaerobaculia bacterium]
MQLRYDSEGDGPLVVLLHGFPESRFSWRRQLPALAQAGFRAVAPDLPGYGDSPKPHGLDAYRVSSVAADVAALIESLGGAPCVLAGHDWGAAVAWYVAMNRPELLRKLVILNVPPPQAIWREVKRSFRQKINLSYQLFFQLPLLPELTMRLFGRRFLRKLARFTEEEIETYVRQWRGSLTPMIHYYRALRRTRREGRAAFQPVLIPTLIIWGEQEPVFLPSTVEDIEKWVPDVRVERVPGAGHVVQTDAPERVNALLIDFAR